MGSSGNTKNVITPDLTTLFKLQMESALVETNCISLGTIESFDAELQTAEISINYKRKISISKEEKESAKKKGIELKEFIEYPLLVDCPVVFLSGGDSHLTMPVAQGDTCIVLFCDRDIDTWFDSGIVTEPNSRRIHSINDGIALVGIRSKKNPIENFNEVIASLIDQSGERLAQAGDTKTSFKTANHSGWLILDGSTIGNADSGADYDSAEYEELFNIVKEVYPNLGTEVFEDDDVVFLPDMRGRSSLGADNMGGSQANVLSTTFTANRNVLGGLCGEESHLLTGRESGIQQHTHTYSRSILSGNLSGSDSPYNVNYNTQNTGATGHTDAIDEHNTVHPTMIMYWFIKI